MTDPTAAAELAALPYYVRAHVQIMRGCFVWTGAMTGPDASQPRAWDPELRRLVTVSRHVFEITRGRPVDRALVVLRRCGNPRCVRPRHLVTAWRGEHRAPIIVGRALAGRWPS